MGSEQEKPDQNPALLGITEENADAHNLVISAYRDWEKVVTFDDEASLMDLVPRLSIEQSSSYLQLEGSSNSNKVLSSQNFDKFSYLQQNVSSPHIMQYKYSIRGLSNLDGYFHSVNPVNIMLEQPSKIPVQVAKTLLCNAESMSQAFCAYEQLKCFGIGSLQDSDMQSSADLQSVVNCFLPCPVVPLYSAQRRWKILFSVFKMILNKKNYGKQLSCRNSKVFVNADAELDTVGLYRAGIVVSCN
ncbi:Hypothetical predicted protein [Olea europaea subsp. europaea]|uniref:Uncharacterized protein n=1 Tax=Olea europaea subsp. europaea TaxID=158383 RepID=A0A8S0U2R2_OLEEU|nr:Hypothetical predicted protein [Olea europaea subsp. europaea]